MKPYPSHPYRRQRGASTIEFLVVAPVLAAMGLGTVQTGLAYHGKTVLNYATFEAARTGAVNHALAAPMRRELAMRLAPLVGGDGSDEAAAMAVGVSLARVTPDPFTRVEVVNPSTEAFDHFQIRSRESGRQVIPNSHLRFRDDDAAGVDPVSGVHLRDANLLKIKVTYGFDMKVPLIGRLAAPVMSLIDPSNILYYQAGKLPLSAVATVRMQSEVWRDSLVSMVASPDAGDEPPGSDSSAAPIAGMAPVPDDPSASDGTGETDDSPAAADDPLHGCQGIFTDGSDPFLPTADPTMCEVAGSDGFASGERSEDPPASSPLPGDETAC